MLASVLRLEALLKCDLCDNLLRTTRTLKECGHRYCEDCVYDRLGEERQCPKCHIPSIVKNLRPDPLHDTLVACVKKLKLCMMDTEFPSLSLPPFDSSFNVEAETPQQLSLDRDLPTSPSCNSGPANGFVERHFGSSDLAPRQHPPPSQPQQHLQNTFDSEATTQSSQHLPTLPASHHQALRSDEYPTAPTKSHQQPDPNSTDDLLLAMENEEINHDDSDHDDPTSTHGASDTTQPPVSSSLPGIKQQPVHYSNTDDLLAAMESEEMVFADDDDDDDFLIPQPSALKKRMPPPCTTNLKRHCNDIDRFHQEPEPKQSKTITHYTAPRSPRNDRPWKCASCLYGGNGAHQLICGICRKERQDAATIDPTLATVPPTLDTSTAFCVPSTLDALQQHEDKVIHLMSTSLSVEDNAMMDTAMAMAIDTCLKLEIYSDTRDVDSVTHLITSVNDHGLCTRTIKYLLCILTGKWIVSASWLTDSVQAGYWLPEERYQVAGDKTSGETHGPDRGRRSKEEDLFYTHGNALRFFFSGDFQDTKVMLLQLVQKGGGKILSRRPTLQQANDVVVIVPSLIDLRRAKPKKSLAWLDTCRHLKDSQWLLDTIARSTLVLDKLDDSTRGLL